MPREAETYAGAECKHGHGCLRYVRSRACVACQRLSTKAYRTREGDNHRTRMRAHSRKRREENPAEHLWYDARERAVKKGLEFTITVSDIVVPEFCPLLDTLLRPGVGKVTPNSPTLDRISNDRGYVPGNVWVVSNAANTCKGALDAVRILQLGARLRLKENALVL